MHILKEFSNSNLRKIFPLYRPDYSQIAACACASIVRKVKINISTIAKKCSQRFPSSVWCSDELNNSCKHTSIKPVCDLHIHRSFSSLVCNIWISKARYTFHSVQKGFSICASKISVTYWFQVGFFSRKWHHYSLYTYTTIIWSYRRATVLTDGNYAHGKMTVRLHSSIPGSCEVNRFKKSSASSENMWIYI